MAVMTPEGTRHSHTQWRVIGYGPMPCKESKRSSPPAHVPWWYIEQDVGVQRAVWLARRRCIALGTCDRYNTMSNGYDEVTRLRAGFSCCS